MGLRETDGVVVRGMTVGKVKEMTLEEDGVHVFLSLDKPLHMKPDYRISVAATSVLGGRHLVIDEGSEGLPELPSGRVFRGEPPYDLMADTAELINAIKEQFLEGGIVDNLRETTVHLRDVAVRISEGQGSLGRLLSDDETLYEDLSSAVSSLRTVSGRLERGEGAIGKLLSSDETVYEDLKAITGSLRKLSERLERGEGTLGRLMAGDDQLYEDLAASAASLRTLSAKLESGEGALGRLVQDDELYDEIRAAVIELRATIDDIRETSPVTTFTSVFFGAF